MAVILVANVRLCWRSLTRKLLNVAHDTRMSGVNRQPPFAIAEER
jgi:hypothetical protein